MALDVENLEARTSRDRIGHTFDRSHLQTASIESQSRCVLAESRSIIDPHQLSRVFFQEEQTKERRIRFHGSPPYEVRELPKTGYHQTFHLTTLHARVNKILLSVRARVIDCSFTRCFTSIRRRNGGWPHDTAVSKNHLGFSCHPIRTLRRMLRQPSLVGSPQIPPCPFIGLLTTMMSFKPSHGWRGRCRAVLVFFIGFSTL